MQTALKVMSLILSSKKLKEVDDQKVWEPNSI